MRDKRLDNICSEILNYMEAYAEISEERVLALFKGLALSDERERPSSYVSLLDKIDEKWNYREIFQDVPEQVFLYGAVWGCLQLMEEKQRTITGYMTEKQTWKTLLSKYRDRINLLKDMYISPGIRHKELAEKEHISPSHLSQIMGTMVTDKIVVYNYAGREKFYYLSEKGEKLYREMKMKKRSKNPQVGSFSRLNCENTLQEGYITGSVDMISRMLNPVGRRIEICNECNTGEVMYNSMGSRSVNVKNYKKDTNSEVKFSCVNKNNLLLMK